MICSISLFLLLVTTHPIKLLDRSKILSQNDHTYLEKGLFIESNYFSLFYQKPIPLVHTDDNLGSWHILLSWATYLHYHYYMIQIV